MNDVFITGYLTKDVELRQTTNNIDFATFTVAFPDRYKAESKTSFMPVVAWRKLALLCGEHIRKGSKVTVVGALSTRDYDDVQGIKRYVTEIVAREMVFYPKPKGEARVLEREEPDDVFDTPVMMRDDDLEKEC